MIVYIVSPFQNSGQPCSHTQQTMRPSGTGAPQHTHVFMGPPYVSGHCARILSLAAAMSAVSASVLSLRPSAA